MIFDPQQAGPVLGWTSAIAAYGAFIAPVVIGTQIKAATPEYAVVPGARRSLLFKFCLTEDLFTL